VITVAAAMRSDRWDYDRAAPDQLHHME